jgi:tripartite-type tricarboxylate transporter receptor subunit TctC
MSPAARAVLPRRGMALAALAAMGGTARAQGNWPSRPVTIVVPFVAGGSTYFVAQALARRLSAMLGQPFPLLVSTGESGLAGMALVARAAPDGHMLVVSPNSSFAMAVHMVSQPLDVAAAFVPVGLLASNPLVLCVQADGGFRNLDDLTAAARAAPGQISYGAAGRGVSNHMAAELYADGFDLQLRAVHFPGGAPALQALLRGEVNLSFVDLVTAIPRLNAGDLRALAVTSARRVPQLADVPTMAEAGLPGYRATTDFALFAPAGTPEGTIARLSAATRRAMGTEEVRARLAPLAIEPWTGSREEFPAYLEAENRKWRGIIERRGIRPE